jgi:hypothetical protein
MSAPENEEFFIGWKPKQPADVRKSVRAFVIPLLLGGTLLAGVLAVFQRAPDLAAYEWTNIQTFEGILKKTPYPHLLVDRGFDGGFSAYTLVAPTKFGIPAEWCGDMDGRPVRFDGGLILRASGTMIEVVSDAPIAAEDLFFQLPSRQPVDLGTQTFVGEIVDAKCYLGAMNPGRYKPHRACATVCVSGGIPPMLVVNAPGGTTATFLLVGSEGEMINEEILDLLARPVRITGRLTRSQDLWILAADPVGIEPL